MDERLQNFAKEGNEDAFFSVLAEDPYVLDRIDQVPFVTTPLHTAAREGKIHFAKEILNLKPSFAWKRDHLGRGPLRLALEGKHRLEGLFRRDSYLEEKYHELVTWLIRHDSGLVRVKARGMVTPLHYAAQVDDESSLAEFLHVCPSSIEDLTVKSETAVHVALKNGSLKALKVLLGWLQNVNKKEILNREDEEGNNALYTAVSANQPEAVKLLMEHMKMNKKNSKGLTALDIFYDRQGEGLVDAAVGDILLAAKAKRASQLHRPSQKTSLFEMALSFSGRIQKIYGLDERHMDKIPVEVKNVLLVVAVLVATANYQAALSPPGGYWQDDGNLQSAANNTGTSNITTSAISNTNTTTAISNTTNTLIRTEPSEHRAGRMILGSKLQLVVLLFNSVAFFTSLCLISTLVVRLPYDKFSMATVSCMAISYYISVLETFNYTGSTFVEYLFLYYLTAVAFAAYCFPLVLIKWIPQRKV
ncbi:ankyrin repeat-containing protein BDA1-like [Mangifera indica]|uniref:ankyrin repeat-containing protein BDA1-like n=1 Tax=Mangifera indica TaxID=29780 RepID=UPI001CFAB621|nr:ankyrin repeat-containing protein BDA1-like [Mangifera indica]